MLVGVLEGQDYLWVKERQPSIRSSSMPEETATNFTVSGALVCTTRKTYTAETPEQELLLAWEKEGKKHFNHCRKCSKWVIDAMFNPEVAECVECAPFEAEAKFCKTCGAKVEVPGRKCPSCGNTLNYEGRTD